MSILKRIGFSFALFLFFLWLAWNPISQHFMEWTVGRLCDSCFGEKISYEKVHRNSEGEWVLENTSFPYFSAPTCKIKMRVDLKSWTLDTHLIFLDPTIAVNDTQVVGDFFPMPRIKKRFLLFRPKVQIKFFNGNFEVGENRYRLEGVAHLKKKSLGQFYLSREDQRLSIRLIQEKKKLRLDLSGDHFMFSHGPIESMRIDGDATFWISRSGFEKVEGSVQITEGSIPFLNLESLEGSLIAEESGLVSFNGTGQSEQYDVNLSTQLLWNFDKQVLATINVNDKLNATLHYMQASDWEVKISAQSMHRKEWALLKKISGLSLLGGTLNGTIEITQTPESRFCIIDNLAVKGFQAKGKNPFSIESLCIHHLHFQQGQTEWSCIQGVFELSGGSLFGKDRLDGNLEIIDGKITAASEIQYQIGSTSVKLRGYEEKNTLHWNLNESTEGIIVLDHKHFGSFHGEANEIYFDSMEKTLKEIKFDGELGQNGLNIPYWETTIDSLFLSGNLFLHENEESGWEINVNNHTLKGALQIPQTTLEGNLSYIEPGAIFKFKYRNGSWSSKGQIPAALTKGFWTSGWIDLTIRDFDLYFTYDPFAEVFDISRLNGLVLVGKPDRIEEYQVFSDRIHFEKGRQGDFDLWIGRRDRDIIRLAGEVQTQENDEFVFTFNPSVSHLGAAYPLEASCTLAADGTIKSWSFNGDVFLSTMLVDLQRLLRSDLFGLSSNALQLVNEIQNAQGTLAIQASGEQNHWKSMITGDRVKIDQYQSDSFVIDLEGNGQTYHLHHCQIGDLCFAADFHREKKQMIIDFLGVKYGDLSLIGLEGIYDPEKNAIYSKSNLIKLHLDDIAQAAPEIRSWQLEEVNLNKSLDFEYFFPSKILEGTFKWKKTLWHYSFEDRKLHLWLMENPDKKLSLQWSKGLLQSISGKLPGLECQLARKAPKKLQGWVEVDFQKLRAYGVETPLNSWKLGSGYRFEGVGSWNGELHFMGKLSGNAFKIGDNTLKNFQCQIEGNPESLLCTNLTIDDPDVQLTVPTLAFEKKTHGKWQFTSPVLTGSTSGTWFQAYRLKQFEITDWSGLCTGNELQGEGHLEFALSHPADDLFFLPRKGEIDFIFLGDQIQLQKFRKGKRRLKYGFSEESPSRISKDGTIDIHLHNTSLNQAIHLTGSIEDIVFEFE